VSRSPHPARSLEFLSRLHDGELSAAERAHFESHRAHCDECRRAAAEFEEALASYRTAGTSPPPPDLAARILRRLEAANPRRRPFGVAFGIDLKWAGAFTAAIVVVILGYSIASRVEQDRQVRVTFATPPPALPAAPPAPLPGRAVEGRDETEVASAPPLPKAPGGKEPPGAPAAAPAPRSVAADADDLQQAARTREEASNDARKTPPETGASAGASKLSERTASLAAPSGLVSTPARVRITATALDGQGQAPAILNAGQLGLTLEDRGDYVVAVAADGVPIEVSRAGREKKESDPSLQKDAREPLRKLRFAAGAGPRRLLVKVQ
jgi:hypothetical protein